MWFTILSILALRIGAVHPPAQDTGPVAAFETVTLDGRVIGLVEALARRGISADPGPIDSQYVLQKADGEIVPLLSGVGSRALFTDPRLRGRATRVIGRRHPRLPYLEVVVFQLEDEDGVYRTPEYHCDVCTISVRFDQICPCCQGPMELRMSPAG